MAGTFAQGSPWITSPFGTPGIGVNPWAYQPQYAQAHTNIPFGGFGASSSFATQPAQQIVQALQFVPQQLQQVLQLAHVQQQQVQYLLQFVPQQLQQLQQLLTQSSAMGAIGPQPFGSPIQQGSPGVSGGFIGQPGYIM
jgi:hypothetical protein